MCPALQKLSLFLFCLLVVFEAVSLIVQLV